MATNSINPSKFTERVIGDNIVRTNTFQGFISAENIPIYKLPKEDTTQIEIRVSKVWVDLLDNILIYNTELEDYDKWDRVRYDGHIGYVKDVLITERKRVKDARTVVLGATLASIGVPVNRKVIRVDPATGLNYETNDVEAQELYNLKNQIHKPLAKGASPYIAIEFMGHTRGVRQASYFVGGIRLGTVSGTDVEVYTDPVTTSQIVTTVTNDDVEVILSKFLYGDHYWYQVRYNDKEGYMISDNVTNVGYIGRDELINIELNNFKADEDITSLEIK